MGLVPLPCSLASKHALWHKGAASGQPACQSAPRSEGTHCPLRRSKSGNYRSFPACLFIAITSPFLAHKEVMGYVERSCGFHHKRSKFIYLFIYLFAYFHSSFCGPLSSELPCVIREIAQVLQRATEAHFTGLSLTEAICASTQDG